MKREGLLHAELDGVIAGLGHGQLLVVADAGLPIPDWVRRIDLAVAPGLPGFLPVLRAVLRAGVFEAASIAQELEPANPSLAGAVAELLGPGIALGSVPHAQLKDLAASATAIVRTGEFTPYANVVLRAGVLF